MAPRKQATTGTGTLVITYQSLDDLVPFERNARTHSAAQISLIEASLLEYGWATSMATADGVLVYGHARLIAAKSLRDKGIAIPHNPDPNLGPVVDLSHLSPAQRRAYVQMDNRSAELAGWDVELLLLEAQELDALGFNLLMTGFDADALRDFIGFGKQEGLTDPDDVPPVPDEPTSVLGDVWLCGPHRVLCGDATSPEAVKAVLAGVEPHLMVTDPPYGVEYDANWRNKALRKDGTPSDGRAIGKVNNDDQADWSKAWVLFPGSVAYVWHAGAAAAEVADSLTASGYEIRSQIIWAKSNFAIGRGHYHWQHEPCWYAVRKGSTGHWNGDHKQTTVWQIDKPRKSETGHSTQKPVECMRRPIVNNSNVGQAVYDPFLGSGTTLIAAHKEGRVCYACELNPAYVDVSVQRWQDHTGFTATLEATGQTRAAVHLERRGHPLPE